MRYRVEATALLYDDRPDPAVILDPPEGSEMLTQGYEPPMLVVEMEAPSQASALAELIQDIDEQLHDLGVDYARIDGHAEPAPRLSQNTLAEMGIGIWTCTARAALSRDLTEPDTTTAREALEANGIQVLGFAEGDDDWSLITVLARGVDEYDVSDRVYDMVADALHELADPGEDFVTGLGVDCTFGLPKPTHGPDQ